MSKTHRILSIDAWADMGGWQWNAWYQVGTITADTLAILDTDQKLLDHMIAEGLIKSTCVLGREVEIEDDQYNVVFSDRTIIDSGECEDDDCRADHQHHAMPIYAIEYGDTVEGED